MKQIQPTILFSLLFIAVLSSCKISDELQYKGFNNFKVSGNMENPSIGVDVTLYNPNPIGVKIKTMNLTVDVNHSQLGTIGLDDPVKLKSKQNFTLPIMMETSMEQLQTLTKPGLQSLLFDKPLAVEISGTITLRKFIFKKTYDFNYADELNVKDIKTK
jgi:LEA14-like dessication related protein